MSRSSRWGTPSARAIGYLFVPDIPASLARNRQRAGRERVPDVAIFSRAKLYEPPTRAEGFAMLFRVTLAGNDVFGVHPLD